MYALIDGWTIKVLFVGWMLDALIDLCTKTLLMNALTHICLEWWMDIYAFIDGWSMNVSIKGWMMDTETYLWIIYKCFYSWIDDGCFDLFMDDKHFD